MTDPARLARRAQLAVLLDRADRLTADEAALLRTLVTELATTPAQITGDPMPQPQAKPVPRGIGAIGVGMPALLHLEAFGREIDDAFGHLPCLVGSAATSKTWRDVDVRLILPDAEFDALFPEHTYPARHDGRWGLLCAAISELARVRTGLPVDFQIQCQSIADECYPGVRYALGIHSNGGH